MDNCSNIMDKTMMLQVRSLLVWYSSNAETPLAQDKRMIITGM